MNKIKCVFKGNNITDNPVIYTETNNNKGINENYKLNAKRDNCGEINSDKTKCNGNNKFKNKNRLIIYKNQERGD